MPISRFITILKAHSIAVLLDIRRIPRSLHNPQFNSDVLEESLEEEGIDYVHMQGLGGLRRPSVGSENTGWRNLSFRGYADYMQTEAFEAALNELIASARKRKAAMMCAEGNPFQCHRSLVADSLTVRGIRVIHISSTKAGRPHTLTPFARVSGGKIRYVAERRSDSDRSEGNQAD